MATYFVLGRFTGEGIEKLATGKMDAELTTLLGSELGASSYETWFTTGAYDIVIVLEVENSRTAITFAAAFASIVGAETTTLAADDELGTIIDAVTGAHTRHAARGDVGPVGGTAPGGPRRPAEHHEDQGHTRHEDRYDIG